jgi:hypothetical protein
MKFGDTGVECTRVTSIDPGEQEFAWQLLSDFPLQQTPYLQ